MIWEVGLVDIGAAADEEPDTVEVAGADGGNERRHASASIDDCAAI